MHRLYASAVGTALAILVPTSVASADAFFKTPSGNILCQQVNSKRWVECSVASSRHGSSLTVYYVRRAGGARTFRSGGNPAFEVPTLRYGRRKHLLNGGVVCTSRKSGLTCRNRSGHGFVLSAERQRRF